MGVAGGGDGRVGGKVRQFLKVLVLLVVSTSLAIYSITSDNAGLFGTTPNSFISPHTLISDSLRNKLCHNSTGSGGTPCDIPNSLYREKGVEYVVFEEGCKLMSMDPFHKDVLRFLKKSKQKKCRPALVKTLAGTANLAVDQKLASSWKYLQPTCCYREISRVTQTAANYDENADFRVKTSAECRAIPSQGELRVAPPTEFVKVECRNGLGVKSFDGFDAVVHPPREFTNATAAKAAFWEEQFIRKNKTLPPSVLVIGVDSISRLHMRRSLPKTRAFLQSEDFVELLGYTKVGENTFPNIMAGFAGLTPKGVGECWGGGKEAMDRCGFIWRNFSAAHYVTGFAEDAPGIAIFNYMKTGFVAPPADYYLRPLMVADHLATKRRRWSADAACLRGLPSTAFLAAYLKDFARAVSVPAFLLAWFTTVGHDDFNLLRLEDAEFEALLRALVASAGPRAVLLFISDHGYRFGPFRQTPGGAYEDALPFAFLRLPPPLRASHPHWHAALRAHATQLTSPFHLHATLTDLLHLAHTAVGAPPSPPLAPSVAASSLFAPPNPNTTCEDAGIPGRYCMCGVSPTLFSDSARTREWGELLVRRLNELLAGRTECAALRLRRILYAREVGRGEKWREKSRRMDGYADFVLAAEVSPGGGRFETRLRHFAEGAVELAAGDVGRINSYAGQSDCVAGDAVLRNFCACNDLLKKKKKPKGKRSS